jgi:2-polyprenyl-6-methoxyphenol hydroxylase-like FAD-dependent oxidoreductase
LDIHRSSGQDALKEAGCFEEFKEYARYGYATIHSVWESQGNKLFTFGEGRDSPEIDRARLKQTLLLVIPDGKMRRSTGVESATRDEDGKIVLSLAYGTNVSGFDLVVGADGAWS